ncbi:toprim domain-containing protein [Acidovorax sp. K2F]|uniref:toprim domain-containing protein n=1 Tax=Acidovorax sp. K2F TaxID=2978125 RepID=UPI0021B0C18A|nr:hypothetical protein [Acidovorax sp. K2F]MCT6721640.1 hypothetical protein [Acidovorax sp. K2F]
MTTFIDFARAHGVEIDPVKLMPRDKVVRCPTTEHPRSRNGAYFWDGQRGWVFAWDGEARTQWFNDPEAKPWTEEEKRQWKAKRDAQRQAQQQGYQRAAIKAQELLRTTTPGPHNYLFYKGLPNSQGLCTPDGDLVVPMRDWQTNAVRGAQLIRWTDTEDEPGRMRWVKKMTYGMQARGAVLRLGPPRATETIYCEGFATGLSIEAAVKQMRLNAAVLVCFSDSNMVYVAQQTKGRRYTFADHDKSGAGERAAKEMGLPYCMSPVMGEDANDMHKRAGLLAVCGLLMQVRRESGM